MLAFLASCQTGFGGLIRSGLHRQTRPERTAPHLIIWGVVGENPPLFPIIWDIPPFCYILDIPRDKKKGDHFWPPFSIAGFKQSLFIRDNLILLSEDKIIFLSDMLSLKHIVQ